MSLGNQLIHSILAASASTAWRDLKRAYLLDTEVPVYDFVQSYFDRHGVLPTANIVREQGYILAVIDGPPTYYEDEVRRRYTYTAVSTRMRDINAAMQDRSPEQAVDIMEQIVSDARGVMRPTQASTLVEQYAAVLADMDEARRTIGLRGVTMGWPTLDLITNGVQGGELVVVAGRPGMGKTWTLIEMAYQAWLANKSIMFCSMEMGLVQIARRWMGRQFGVNPNFIRSGQVSSWMEEQLRAAAFDDAGLRVRLMSGDAVRDIGSIDAAIAHRLPDAIYIDAAYLLSPVADVKRYGASRWEELTEVVRQLKALAIRYNRPIFLTFQLNRQVKQRGRRELELSDIGGTDAIPQDASIVLGMLFGNPPLEKVRRILQMMKNREGEMQNLLINYGFTPVSFHELPMDDSGAELVDTNVGWME